ncbi:MULTISPECIES: sensor histidine kinase [Bradyrhizobium]|nr:MULTISPECIES: sensor histidine kinase [Bradyrhizobium]MCA1514464.1 sensor histidine kinase [Bradyrhizobium sp. NBAIM01]
MIAQEEWGRQAGFPDRGRMRMRVWFLALLTLASCLLEPSAALAQQAKRVVILHSFGRDFRPWGQYAKSIREQLDRLSPWHLDIQDHSLVAARFGDEDPQAAFVSYLKALNARHQPDLIVSIGAPAANFVQRNRSNLFPRVPMVLTAVEQRRVDSANLSPEDSVVAVAHDFPRSFNTILKVLPATKRIVVVNGASPNEMVWRREIQKDADLFAGKVEFIWHDGMSFEAILQICAALPPDSAIFWHLMNVDATGVAYEGDRALQALHKVANAPIFSYDDGFFGREIVGGPMYSVEEISRLTATVAVRLLGGEKPADARPAAVRFAAAKFDWRQLHRWGISESRLPPGSEVFFREPSIWQRYRWQMLMISAAFLVQAGLISGLLHERRRRRFAEIESRQRLAELAHANRYSAVGELTTSIAHELNQPLGSILTNAETAELMLRASSPDIDEVRQILADIRRDDQRASEVIRRLRSILKKAPFEVRIIELNDTVREAIDLVKTLAGGRRISLIYVPLLTQLHVKGDPVQLQQVILNLIINAMDAISDADAGKREVSVSTLSTGNQAEIRIADTGPGIPASDLASLFDPFFTTKPQGMGMGLAIARTIVEAHHGTIAAANQPAGGALFTIRLPTAR